MKQKNTRMIAFAAAVMMAAGALVSCGSKDVNSGPVTSDQKSRNEVSAASDADKTDDTAKGSTASASGQEGTKPQSSREIKTEGEAAAEAEGTYENHDMAVNSPNISKDMTGGVGLDALIGPTVENPNTESYAKVEENGFKLVKDEPVSTFSTDVDTASSRSDPRSSSIISAMTISSPRATALSH